MNRPASPGLRLYSTDHSPFAARVRMAALYKGIELPQVFPPGGPSSPQFRALTGLGMVPALELQDDAAVLPESEVIVEYLEDRFPEPSLRPASPLARARARLLARVADLYLAPPLRELFEHAKTPADAGADPRPAAERVRGALAALEEHIGHEGYAVGSRPSTADCALVPLFFFLVRCGPVLERADGRGTWHAAKGLHDYWQAVQGDGVAARVLHDMELAQHRRALERSLHGRNAVA